VVSAAVALLGVVGLGASEARPANSDQITIGLLAQTGGERGLDVLIANFERVYPQITVVPNYLGLGGPAFSQEEALELAAGSAPAILQTTPGCGALNAVCELAKAGDLAPMIGVPWAKRQPRGVTSLEKREGALVAFAVSFTPFGIYTNDALFARLGLKVPETFAQLLAVCQKAKADGTVAALFDATNKSGMSYLVYALAATTVYRADPRWNVELKAGRVSFAGSPGWRQALQEVIDMKNAGCFSPGVTSGTNIVGQFAQGEGLMLLFTSGAQATLDAADPQFPHHFRLFPAGDSPAKNEVMIVVNAALSVNSHSSPAQQAAAQTFINFVARPAQDALYAQVKTDLTPEEFLNDQLPPFMSSLAAPLAAHDYVLQPSASWWNGDIQAALQQQAIGLFTGQETPDSILRAMDAAWKQGPA
jgi:raffinose/stachyose/melibiose transport system substrate-binding protein